VTVLIAIDGLIVIASPHCNNITMDFTDIVGPFTDSGVSCFRADKTASS
jgi:hypothetical protein